LKKKNKLKHTDLHHRKPRSRGGTDYIENISRVPRKKHVAWHRLFTNMSPQEIAHIISDVWLDPDFYLVAVPRNKKKSPRHKHTLKISCQNCGDQCDIVDMPTRLLRQVRV
jgi:hypothetical protein